MPSSRVRSTGSSSQIRPGRRCSHRRPPCLLWRWESRTRGRLRRRGRAQGTSTYELLWPSTALSSPWPRPRSLWCPEQPWRGPSTSAVAALCRECCRGSRRRSTTRSPTRERRLRSLASGSQVADVLQVPTAALALKTYAVSLTATHDGGAEEILATARFRVADSTPPILAVTNLTYGMYVQGSVTPQVVPPRPGRARYGGCAGRVSGGRCAGGCWCRTGTGCPGGRRWGPS